MEGGAWQATVHQVEESDKTELLFTSLSLLAEKAISTDKDVSAGYNFEPLWLYQRVKQCGLFFLNIFTYLCRYNNAIFQHVMIYKHIHGNSCNA